MLVELPALHEFGDYMEAFVGAKSVDEVDEESRVLLRKLTTLSMPTGDYVVSELQSDFRVLLFSNHFGENGLMHEQLSHLDFLNKLNLPLAPLSDGPQDLELLHCHLFLQARRPKNHLGIRDFLLLLEFVVLVALNQVAIVHVLGIIMRVLFKFPTVAGSDGIRDIPSTASCLRVVY